MAFIYRYFYENQCSLASFLWWKFWRISELFMRHSFDCGFPHSKLRNVMRDEIILSSQRKYPFAWSSKPKVHGLSGDICCNRFPFFLKRVNFDTLKSTLLWNFTQPNTWPFKMGSQETLFYFASNHRKAQVSFTLRRQNLTNRSGA